jgi:hypothetical protein
MRQLTVFFKVSHWRMRALCLIALGLFLTTTRSAGAFEKPDPAALPAAPAAAANAATAAEKPADKSVETLAESARQSVVVFPF